MLSHKFDLVLYGYTTAILTAVCVVRIRPVYGRYLFVLAHCYNSLIPSSFIVKYDLPPADKLDNCDLAYFCVAFRKSKIDGEKACQWMRISDNGTS